MRQLLKHLMIEAAIPLVRIIDRARERMRQRRRDTLLSEFSSAGDEVYVHTSVVVTEPKAVSIGNNVHIGADTYIMSQGGLQIRDNVHIARRVTIYCSDHKFRNGEALPYGPRRTWKQVVIERNVWIGMNTCILPGVTIGEGAIIGMGAIVSKDVPRLSIVGQQPFRILGERDREEYLEAEETRLFGGRDGAIVPVERQKNFPRPGRIQQPAMCFVLTTGRSGSKTIADILNAHPQISAKHEPRHQLIKWSTDYAYGDMNEAQIRSLLSDMFLDASVYREGIVYVESDQKYFNLIPILDELFPSAKFIWLVRSAFDVVSSTVGRSWYANEEHPVWKRIPWHWHEYRIRGDRTGAIAAEEWVRMDPFEKNCWYWSYVNATIERNLAAVSRQRQLLLRLEDLAKETEKMLEFLGVRSSDLTHSVKNAASYPKYDSRTWTPKEQMAFTKWCAPIMAKLYPG